MWPPEASIYCESSFRVDAEATGGRIVSPQVHVWNLRMLEAACLQIQSVRLPVIGNIIPDSRSTRTQ